MLQQQQQQRVLAAALLQCVGGVGGVGGSAANAAAFPSPSFAASPAATFASSAAGADDESLESVLLRELKHEQTTYEQPAPLAKGPPAPFTLTSVPGDGTLTLSRDFNGEKVTVEASLNMQEGAAAQMYGDDDDEDGDDGEGGSGGDDDDEASFASAVSFVVTVERGGEALVFDCSSDGAYLEIEHVALEPAGGAESETAYSGERREGVLFWGCICQGEEGRQEKKLERDHDTHAHAQTPNHTHTNALTHQHTLPNHTHNARNKKTHPGPVFDELADGVREAFERFLAARGVDEDLGEWLRFALYDKEAKEYSSWLERVAKFAAAAGGGGGK